MLKENFLERLKELLKHFKTMSLTFMKRKIERSQSQDKLTTQPLTSTHKEESMEDVKSKLTFYVTFMVSFTLCLSVLAMMAAFVLGLWAKEVDNAEIFKLLSPAFQTIIGGFIGLLAGVKLSHDEDGKCHKCKD